MRSSTYYMKRGKFTDWTINKDCQADNKTNKQTNIVLLVSLTGYNTMITKYFKESQSVVVYKIDHLSGHWWFWWNSIRSVPFVYVPYMRQHWQKQLQ